VWGGQTLTVKGCTFYGNSSGSTNGRGGAIYNNTGTGTITLTGNLFYGNTATNLAPVVYGAAGTVTSGYNVVDVALGTANTESGFAAGTGDTTFSALSISGAPVNTSTFVPVSGLSAVIPATAPEGFPLTDFNGATRTFSGGAWGRPISFGPRLYAQ
jgi:hypothetical protein